MFSTSWKSLTTTASTMALCLLILAPISCAADRAQEAESAPPVEEGEEDYAALGQVALVETGENVIAPPAGTDPFYKKYINADGIVIVSSDQVPDAALTAARRTVLHMLSTRPDIHQAMLPNHPRISVMAISETASDLPEFGPRAAGEWGLGQMLGDPTTLVSERGVCYEGNTEYRANFLAHEFVHMIQNLGWPTTDPEIEDEIYAAYQVAVDKGLFDAPVDEPFGITPYDAYGDDEYLTHGVNAWFDLNETLPGPWVDVQIGESGPPSGTREQLRENDPVLYEIISRFMPDSLGDLMEGCTPTERD